MCALCVQYVCLCVPMSMCAVYVSMCVVYVCLCVRMSMFRCKVNLFCVLIGWALPWSISYVKEMALMVESLDITWTTFHVISPHLLTITCYKSITYGLLLSLTVVAFVLCSFIIGDSRGCTYCAVPPAVYKSYSLKFKLSISCIPVLSQLLLMGIVRVCLTFNGFPVSPLTLLCRIDIYLYVSISAFYLLIT